VVTNSGIFGKVVGLADRVVTLEIAPNVKIRVDRQSIASKDSGTTAEPKAASS
jgi:preprotein translocase YajC subunit